MAPQPPTDAQRYGRYSQHRRSGSYGARPFGPESVQRFCVSSRSGASAGRRVARHRMMSDDNPVRRVTRKDLPELCKWAIPRFRERHPRITVKGMMPMLLSALANPDECYFVMTDNAVGMFVVERAPYEP